MLKAGQPEPCEKHTSLALTFLYSDADHSQTETSVVERSHPRKEGVLLSYQQGS